MWDFFSYGDGLPVRFEVADVQRLWEEEEHEVRMKPERMVMSQKDQRQLVSWISTPVTMGATKGPDCVTAIQIPS